jgi:hypothetical protein
MASQDIAAEVSTWVADEIGKQCFGEAFGFVVAPQFTQSPAGLIPVWAVMITCRNPLVGQEPLWRMTGVPSPRPAEDEMRGHVTRMLRELRDLSAKATAGANGHASAGA